MVQLAPSNAGLATPHFTHQRRHLLVLLLASAFRLALLIVRLPTDADEFTGFGEAQADDLPLLDDPPEGFFTSFTPYSLRMTSSIASSSCVF
jgi:hypothetical protein